jgi:hypothetical protein
MAHAKPGNASGGLLRVSGDLLRESFRVREDWRERVRERTLLNFILIAIFLFGLAIWMGIKGAPGRDVAAAAAGAVMCALLAIGMSKRGRAKALLQALHTAAETEVELREANRGRQRTQLGAGGEETLKDCPYCGTTLLRRDLRAHLADMHPAALQQ